METPTNATSTMPFSAHSLMKMYHFATHPTGAMTAYSILIILPFIFLCFGISVAIMATIFQVAVHKYNRLHANLFPSNALGHAMFLFSAPKEGIYGDEEKAALIIEAPVVVTHDRVWQLSNAAHSLGFYKGVAITALAGALALEIWILVL